MAKPTSNIASGYFCLSGPIQLTKVSQQTWRGEETLGGILPLHAPSRFLLNGTLCESGSLLVFEWGWGQRGDKPRSCPKLRGLCGVSPQKVNSYKCNRKPSPGLWTLAGYEHTRHERQAYRGRDTVRHLCFLCDWPPQLLLLLLLLLLGLRSELPANLDQGRVCFF